MLIIVLACAALAGCGGGGHSGPPAALLHPDKLTAKAPQLFTATFKTTKGTFQIEVTDLGAEGRRPVLQPCEVGLLRRRRLLPRRPAVRRAVRDQSVPERVDRVAERDDPR